jgi:hypothetical protein
MLEPLRALLPGMHQSIFGDPVSFNSIFQPALFPSVPWGMASNAWAEYYACGGWMALLALIFLFFIIIRASNQLLWRDSKHSSIVTTIVLSCMIPFVFFIHRSDLAFQFVYFRDSLFAFFGAFLLGAFIQATLIFFQSKILFLKQ